MQPRIVIDIDYLLRQLDKNSYKWVKVPAFKPNSYATLEEKYAALEKHHIDETGFLIKVIHSLCQKMKDLPPEVRDRMLRPRETCDCICHKNCDIMHFEPCCDNCDAHEAPICEVREERNSETR